ncbi:UNVERIFIED_CONTAM: hypothetical protein Slati_3427400 [Sesamum latifolium]|uniref:Uncharacterized protein n=1 Tax=Sesamum latifolium TaxID=2727402 RepID=A0AAW2UGH3_9LAMI
MGRLRTRAQVHQHSRHRTPARGSRISTAGTAAKSASSSPEVGVEALPRAGSAPRELADLAPALATRGARCWPGDQASSSIIEVKRAIDR